MEIIKTKERTAMSVFTDDQIDTLEKAIKTVDRHLSIAKVDYDAGTISVGMTYNEGTDSEWVEDDFLVVNVASDSVAAAFYDVYTQAYSRCI